MMPAAANLSNLKTIVGEAAPTVPPGAAEMFATLIAASSTPETVSATSVPVEGQIASEPDREETAEAVPVDASILLPLLDQQRAAAVPVSAPKATAPVVQALGPEQKAPDITTSVERPGVRSEVSLIEAQAAVPAAGAARPDGEATAPQVKQGQAASVASTVAPQARDSGATPEIQGAAAQTPASPGQPQAAATAPRPEKAGCGREAQASPAAIPTADTAEHMSAPATRSAVEAPVAQPAGAAVAAAQIASDLRRVAQPAPGAPQPSDAAPASPPVAAAAGPSEAVSQLRKQTLSPVQQDRLLGAQPTPGTPGQEPLPSPAAAATPVPAAAPAVSAQIPGPNLQAAIEAQVLNVAKDGAWIDDLARDISRTASGEGTMRFRLAPETLGELRVEITQSERGAHVRLQVTSEAAQQALAEAQPKLVQEARAQGVRIAETEISFAGGQGQNRETGRHAQSEQPMRSAGSGRPSTHGDAEAPSGPRRGDLYA